MGPKLGVGGFREGFFAIFTSLRDLQVLAQRRKDRKEQACRKLTEWSGHALVLAAFDRELRFRRHVVVEPGDARPDTGHVRGRPECSVQFRIRSISAIMVQEPAGVGHRGIDVFVNVITVPGFKPYNEYYIDKDLQDETQGRAPYNENLLGIRNYQRIEDLL